MTIEELNYKLTGIKNPRYLTSDQKLVIEHCLVIINEIEQNSHKHSVMQGLLSDCCQSAVITTEIHTCEKCACSCSPTVASSAVGSQTKCGGIEVCEDCPYKMHPCPEGCSKKV